MKHRKLTLRKETLAELATEELAAVVGGNSDTCVTFTVVLTGCQCTGMFVSLNVNCPTGRPCQN